ncbi:MAG: HXXEE domain-containing protein [Prevotella sp.]|nr:HXXEE domain-containing protein [Prevotella sp.]
MKAFLLFSFLLAFLIHETEEILVQHKWMLAHKDELVMRFPRIKQVIHHLSTLHPKAFLIAVAEESLMLLLITVFVIIDVAYAKEMWTAVFMAFSIHLVVHLLQGIMVRGYVPGLITSVILLPYSFICIHHICNEIGFGALTLLSIIGFLVMVVNLRFAHWLGIKCK